MWNTENNLSAHPDVGWHRINTLDCLPFQIISINKVLARVRSHHDREVLEKHVAEVVDELLRLARCQLYLGELKELHRRLKPVREQLERLVAHCRISYGDADVLQSEWNLFTRTALDDLFTFADIEIRYIGHKLTLDKFAACSRNWRQELDYSVRSINDAFKAGEYDPVKENIEYMHRSVINYSIAANKGLIELADCIIEVLVQLRAVSGK